MTVRVKVDIRSGGRVFSETATTLGAGGLFIETDDPLPRNAFLDLCFQLPSSERIFEFRGRVVWSTPGDTAADGASVNESRGMGIEFTDRVAVSALAREIESYAQ